MLLCNLAAILGLLVAAVGSLAGAAAAAVAAVVALAVFGITAAIAGGIGFVVRLDGRKTAATSCSLARREPGSQPSHTAADAQAHSISLSLEHGMLMARGKPALTMNDRWRTLRRPGRRARWRGRTSRRCRRRAAVRC